MDLRHVVSPCRMDSVTFVWYTSSRNLDTLLDNERSRTLVFK